MRKLRRWAGGLILALVLPPVLYLAAALVLSRIPVNTDFRPAHRGVRIGVIDNGVHTDLILPVRAGAVDWRRRFPLAAFPGLDAAAPGPRYLSLGWGHREFYLTTPTWADIRAVTAAKALLGIGGSVLHVSYWPGALRGDNVVWVRVSKPAYAQLVAYVEASLKRDAVGRTIAVAGVSYRRNDDFFEAEGRFGPFSTCNEWSRRALAAAGVQTGLWTPFSGAILAHLRGLSAP